MPLGKVFQAIVSAKAANLGRVGTIEHEMLFIQTPGRGLALFRSLSLLISNYYLTQKEGALVGQLEASCPLSRHAVHLGSGLDGGGEVDRLDG